jgi:curved DNA-binding protein
MEYKDYYQILGVSKNADSNEIKKAFRKLARQHHPDANPDDPKAEARFKEINEAYEVLKDPEKRARYDQIRQSYQSWQHRGGQPGSFDWSQWMGGMPGGVRVEYGSGSADPFSEFFQAIFGGMGAQQAGGMGFEDLLGGGRQRRAPARGQDLTTDVEITLDEAYHGTTRVISKEGRRIQIKIPPGARTGTRVRVAGEGASGISESHPGDLFLNVRVKDDPRFRRDEDDLLLDVTIDLYTAVLGGEIDIPTMTGRVTLKVSEGTQPGQRIRLRGKGMPRLHNRGEYGDLYVRINVQLPTHLTDQERNLFYTLASLQTGSYDQ